MTDASGLRELIHRYIDYGVEPAELRSINDLLVSDPRAADTFAEMTRFDALLSQSLRSTPITAVELAPAEAPLFAPRPMRRANRSPWLIPAVAASVALAALALFYGPKRGPEPSIVSGQVLVDGKPMRVVPLDRPVEIAGTEPAVFRLNDASQATLEPSSQGSIQTAKDGERQIINLSQGSGTFKVAHGQGRFQVVTPVATITALGTEFRVRLRSRQPRESRKAKLVALVSVSEGEVQVDAGGASYHVTAGPSRAFGEDGEQNNMDDGDQNNGGQNQGNGQSNQN